MQYVENWSIVLGVAAEHSRGGGLRAGGPRGIGVEEPRPGAFADWGVVDWGVELRNVTSIIVNFPVMGIVIEGRL